ncbi:GNAT family N-acetyltransferase [Microbacterium sp. 3J1]|uniref:GNAT family N-acetyltransferase n=1 Tax=Microbacterium sp. 3J1 TaxID=861269 RepID=UPI000A92AAAF|nr:GNAT family N-acetyltransferase [Microbacterium sp. 3J1]
MEPLTLRPWAADDIGLLRAANTAQMTAQMNGPETEQEIEERSARYLRLSAAGEALMYVIEDEHGAPVGTIGCWHVRWRGEPAWETGWFALPEAQGRGVASRALELLVTELREHRAGRRSLVAFPAVGNVPSNGVCRHSGFEMVGTQIEAFRGADLEVNEWVLDLEAPVSG